MTHPPQAEHVCERPGRACPREGWVVLGWPWSSPWNTFLCTVCALDLLYRQPVAGLDVLFLLEPATS